MRGQETSSSDLLADQSHRGQLRYTHSSQLMVARIYLRISTEEQELTRQEGIEQATQSAGYYVAGIYREKTSGARADRPELIRMIADLQSGEVVVAEKIYRISRLPLAEAEQLVASIKAKGAKLAIPDGISSVERGGSIVDQPWRTLKAKGHLPG